MRGREERESKTSRTKTRKSDRYKHTDTLSLTRKITLRHPLPERGAREGSREGCKRRVIESILRPLAIRGPELALHPAHLGLPASIRRNHSHLPHLIGWHGGQRQQGMAIEPSHRANESKQQPYTRPRPAWNGRARGDQGGGEVGVGEKWVGRLLP